VLLWEDAAILRNAGIPVRVYGRAAREGAPVNIIPLRTRSAHLNSFEYGGLLLHREREATIIAYNEPALAGLAPDRTIVRYDWNTPLPRYWNWPLWLPRFQRARYLFPSESERQLFHGQHGRIPISSTFVIPNAVDLNLFRSTGAVDRSRSEGNLRVGFAGQWVPGKGINELIDAWQSVKVAMPSAELYLAGGSALWKNVHGVAQSEEAAAGVAEAQEKGLLNCVGAIPRSQMPAFWASLDVAVMPSLSESFGLVALEALACGVPVVSTTAGGLKEIVVDGECGLLVPPADAKALAHALLRLLTDQDLRLRLARGARRRAATFSLERRSFELLQLLRDREGQRLSAIDAVTVGT
jgi:glycosyltransferase involved in cell wall biosynthesis